MRYLISAPAGERASGVDGKGRVCMGNLRVLPTTIHSLTSKVQPLQFVD
jgi:hypothetical protein